MSDYHEDPRLGGDGQEAYRVVPNDEFAAEHPDNTWSQEWMRQRNAEIATLTAALDEAKRGLEAIRAQQITSFSYEPDPYTLGRIYGDKLERIFEIMRATLTCINAIERGEAKE